MTDSLPTGKEVKKEAPIPEVVGILMRLADD